MTEKIRKALETAQKPLFTNNSRRAHGLPTRRKLNRRKRFYSLRECETSINALLDFFDNAFVKTPKEKFTRITEKNII